MAIHPSLNPSGSQRKAPKRHDPNVPVLCDTLVFCSSELSRMGPVEVIQQVAGGMLAMCLRLGRMALFPEVGETGPLSKVTQFHYCLGLHQEPHPEKEGPHSHCWLQPADPSAGPEYSRVGSPAVSDQEVHTPGWCLNNKSVSSLKGGAWVSQAD